MKFFKSILILVVFSSSIAYAQTLEETKKYITNKVNPRYSLESNAKIEQKISLTDKGINLLYTDTYKGKTSSYNYYIEYKDLDPDLIKLENNRLELKARELKKLVKQDLSPDGKKYKRDRILIYLFYNTKEEIDLHGEKLRKAFQHLLHLNGVKKDPF